MELPISYVFNTVLFLYLVWIPICYFLVWSRYKKKLKKIPKNISSSTGHARNINRARSINRKYLKNEFRSLVVISFIPAVNFIAIIESLRGKLDY